MNNKLENIGYEEVVSPLGKSYAVLRKELKPGYKKVFWDVLKGYVFLLLIFLTDFFLLQSGHFNIFIGIPVSAFLTGYCLAYLHLFVHAAAHYELHPSKTKNDILSDLFIGVFFGMQQKKYRKVHWLHHSNLGTKNDTEHSYFNELNTLFLLKCVTGLHTLSVILSRRKTAGQFEHSPQAAGYTLYVFLFHAVWMVILYSAGGWMMLLIWLGGLLVVFPVLATIRQLMEHRDAHASGNTNYSRTDHGKVSRLFGEGLIDSSFGAAGFNKHLLHHWDPTISYTRLHDVEHFLLHCPQTAPVIKESKTSYLKTFIALFKF